MSKIWLVSDTHFFHSRIIEYCNRPFQTADEMNFALIKNWNSVVSDNDIVYHLGDVTWKRCDEILSVLKGKKELILGNHDDIEKHNLQQHFRKIHASKKLSGNILLTHYPVVCDFGNQYNVHGHIHDKNLDSKQHINVSVEQTEYTPIQLESLLERIHI